MSQEFATVVAPLPVVADILRAIETRLGFVPPFYEPAFDAPEVLQNLWGQTLSAYLDNPLPDVFKEQLSAYLSRYCAQPYCMVVHSSSLRPLGFDGREILQLVEARPPDGRTLADDVDRLRATAGPLDPWPDPRTPLWDSLLQAAIATHLRTDGSEHARAELRRLLGVDYARLSAYLGYIETCLAWIEAHPEIQYRADRRAIDHLGPLAADEPRLTRFLDDYRERVADEQPLRRQLLEEIDRRRLVEDDLRAALAIKDEFVGMVSHELRAPLTVIGGNADLLRTRSDLPSDVVAGAIAEIAAESDHLASIVENMLTLVRIDRREMEDREPVRIERLIGEIVADWERRMPDRIFIIRCESTLPIVDADPVAIRQVVDNLIGNAVKYSPSTARIEVDLEAAADGVLFAVLDRGPGIAADEMEAVFDLFHRSPMTDRIDGIGIGLTVCRRLVEAHGGTIRASARPGGGSTFVVSLPPSRD